MPNISTSALTRNILIEYVRFAEQTYADDLVIDPDRVSFDIGSNLDLMQQLANSGRTIALIRAARWTTGWDLRTCKKLVDLAREHGADAFSMLTWV